MSKAVFVVTLLCIRADRLLLVKKRGLDAYILPGGKPNLYETLYETDVLDTLLREVKEELGCTLYTNNGTIAYQGVFIDDAADGNSKVAIMCFSGNIRGEPVPSSEIENYHWYDIWYPDNTPIAPSLKNHILPYIRENLCPKD